MTDLAQNEEATLDALAHRMGEAERARDGKFFETLLADKLTFRRANKTVVDKQTYLSDLLNPENSYDLLELDDLLPNILDNIAIVTLLVRAKGVRDGTPFSGVYRNIRIFVHEPDKQQPWQLHAWFNERVGDLPG